MRRTTAAFALALALGMLAPGCRQQAPPSTAADRPPAAVETVAVEPREIVEGIDVVGTLSPRVSADIKSEVSGHVAEVLVMEWARVKRGEPLARIDTTEIEAQLRKAKAAVQAVAAGSASARAALAVARSGATEVQVAVDRAEREHARLRGLKEGGLATQQSLDEALTAQEAAAARLATLQGQIAAAEAQVRLAEAQEAVAAEDVRQIEARTAKSVVRAPFDGIVAERLVNVGEVVGEMQKVVFRLVDNRLLDLTVQVPARLFAAVRVGQPISFTVDALPGRAFAGTVKYLNPAMSEADRSVRIVAEVPNADGELRGGVFVRGRIETARRAGVLLVPRASLLEWDTGARRGTLLLVEDGIARRRAVRTGEPRGEDVEIVEGAAAGDRAVARGGFTIHDGDRVTVVGPGK